MKAAKVILIIAAASAGCKTTSKVQTGTTHTQDSTSVKDQGTTARNDSTSHVTHIEDTTIGLKGTDVLLTLTPRDLLPTYTTTGIQTARTYAADNGNAHARVTVNTDGSIRVDCKTDSLTLVIQRLIRDSVYMQSKYDSLRMMKVLTNHKSDTEDISIIKTTKTLWGKLWPYIVVAAFLAACIFIAKLFKVKL